MKTLAVAAVTLLALAGCGSSDSGPGPGVPPQQVAAQLDCTGGDGSSSNKLTCEFQGSTLKITSYKSKDDLKPEASPGVGKSVLVNDDELWMIAATDFATLEAAQEIVGGQIR